MPLHLRRRGDVWHARGTVRVGQETVHVAEFSTGSRSRSDAETLAGEYEAKIRRDEIDGDRGRQARLILADCFEAYLLRPGGVKQYDKDRIADFSQRIGHRPLKEAGQAWKEWLSTRGSAMAPTTAARWRAIYMASIRAGCDAHEAPVPKVSIVKTVLPAAPRYLTDGERAALLAAYGLASAPVFLVLAYQGLRTSEALHLDWRHVAWQATGALYIPRTKSGKPRAVPMHARVRAELFGLWEKANQPDAGPVFLSSRKLPWADTRGKGGNPLKRAHQLACARVGVTNFRIHDWRHDWAVRMVAAGVDLISLMQLGGWSSLRMVEIYAAHSAEHLAQAANRIA